MSNFKKPSTLPTILPTILLSCLATFPFALANGVIGEDKGPEPTSFATALTGGEGCSHDQISHIRSGFAEMALIFQSAIPYEPISQPGKEFFGHSPAVMQNYTEMVAMNLQRAANYAKLEGSEGPINADIHVRCDDPMEMCEWGNKREGNHAAYNIGNEPHVVFCEDYFRLPALREKMDKTAEDQTEKEKLMEYYTRATLWARMVMHFASIGKAVVAKATPAPEDSPTEWIVTTSEGAMNTSVLAGVLNERPDGNGPDDVQTLKYAYGATRAKLLAVLSTQMPYDATNNAENYALYAQARYVMREKGFYPSLPIRTYTDFVPRPSAVDFPNEATVLTNENLQDGERIRHAYFDMTDVVPRPEDMKLEGEPLPSSGTLDRGAASTRVMWSMITVAITVIFSSYS